MLYEAYDALSLLVQKNTLKKKNRIRTSGEIRLEAYGTEIFEDIIRGTKKTISHAGIFDYLY